ncbi:hypothetical protein GCM10010251_89910 [Streptomyces aurantiogriseus]|uniref:Uncharacterized protein n=1 Tax=Streptomyces aurantiogriseus TaxID=66870 RepID=A0A918FNL9_9ACTN|nr:hypothetical protein GCM10010251_89910 [Streptomyces aurantiogriseus]
MKGGVPETPTPSVAGAVPAVVRYTAATEGSHTQISSAVPAGAGTPAPAMTVNDRESGGSRELA